MSFTIRCTQKSTTNGEKLFAFPKVSPYKFAYRRSELVSLRIHFLTGRPFYDSFKSFGVKKNRLPALKAQLIETLIRFMEDCDDGEEDEIVSLGVTLI